MTADDWNEQLDDLAALGLRRSLRLISSAQNHHITSAGRELVNFASNNYLGLAAHPHVTSAVKAAVDEWGWGAGASRLVSGHMEPHRCLEERLAAFKRAEAALVCPTGYAANLAAVRALGRSGDAILLDKLNHASIIDAAMGSGAIVRVYPHGDLSKLERLLERTADAPRRIIVTDSVFSMDGDLADLPRLVELKQRYRAMLVVDEAHATGVFGKRGAGVAEWQGVEHQIDVVVGTLSKALGGIGGFIAAARLVIDWIINTAGPFIYTTGIPPAACVAAMAALDVVVREPERRRRVLESAVRVRETLQALGWKTGPSCSQIIPVIVGDAERAVALSRRLEESGLLVPAIRPPTVPRGSSRLRISLSSEHTPDDLERLLEALGEAR